MENKLKEKNVNIDTLKINKSENYQIKGVNTIEQLKELEIL